jgi:hypothetical protein
MPRTLATAAAFVLLSAGLAQAQITDSLPGYGGPDDYNYQIYSILPDYEQVRSPEQLRRDAEIERRYNETLRTKIPDKKASSNDPWRTVRRAPSPPVVNKPDRYRPE